MLALLVLGVMVAAPALAAEIITAEDIKQFIVKESHLVRLADNAIFLFDASSSMNQPFRDTGKSKYDLVVGEFKNRVSYFPEIGHTFGLYVYTPWKDIYPAKTFNREKFAAALNSLPDKPTGPTPLRKALRAVDPILKPLTGKTILYLFTDGTYSKGEGEDSADIKRKSLLELAQDLTGKYNVCFYLISTAKDKDNKKMLEKVAELNACSRVIPLEDFLDRPEYSSGSLFEVKATEKLVTVMEKRIVGLKVQNATFRFDKENIRVKDLPELSEVVAFLAEYPQSYIVLRGYTDSVGKDEYNLALSKRRAMAVADFLMEMGIEDDRIVVQWNGNANPIASNDTDEGRELNRRVEMLVTGL
jgi:OOP family OmpA-OmpF porin